MYRNTVALPEIKLVGIKCRTNNDHIFETNPSTNKIAATAQKYFHNELAKKIPDKINPGVTYCVYTEYESDFRGDYTYFIGEEVNSTNNLPEDYATITIPVQNYSKFTNEPGAMPDVCVDMWKTIWKMGSKELGGERLYLADFEIYDERALDHNKVVLDIYVGIKI